MPVTPEMIAKYPCKQLSDSSGAPIERWITCPVRLAFPALAEPRAMNPSAEPKYQATLLFPRGADLSALMAAARAAATSKFGKGVSLKHLRNPFRDGSEREGYDGFEAGCKFINATSKFKPALIDRNGDDLTADDQRIYPGVWVRAKLTCYAYDQAGNRGVAFGLVSIQRIADDEPFATGGDDPRSGFEIESLPAAAPRAAIPAHSAARHDAPASAPRAAAPAARAQQTRPDDSDLFPGMSNGTSRGTPQRAGAPADSDW